MSRVLETLAKLGGYMVARKESRAEISLMSLDTAQLCNLLNAQIAKLAPAQRERRRLEMLTVIAISDSPPNRRL